MCVLLESHPPAATITAEQLLHEYLPTEPGTIAQLASGTTFLLTDCGEGHAMLELARRFPRSLFAGIDESEWSIANARQKARAAGLANVWFDVGDAATHRFGSIFHVVTRVAAGSSEQPLLPLLDGLHRSLRRGGTLFYRPAAGAVSRRLLEAAFDRVRSITLADDPARPLFVARR